MWTIHEEPLAVSPFEQFDPPDEDILFYYDGPATFLVRNNERELHLAHLLSSDSKTNIFRFVVSKINESILEALKRAELDLRDGLLQPTCYIVDLGSANQIANVWQVQPDDIPRDHLPVVGITLWLPKDHERYLNGEMK